MKTSIIITAIVFIFLSSFTAFGEEGLEIPISKVIGTDKVVETLEVDSFLLDEVKDCSNSLLEKDLSLLKSEAELICRRKNMAKLRGIKMDNMTSVELKKLQLIPRRTLKQLGNVTSESLANFKIIKIRKEEAYRKTDISEKDMLEAETRYKLSDRKYIESKAKFVNRKALFLESNNFLKSCKENCLDVDVKTAVNAKLLISNGIDMGIQHLNKVKYKTLSNDDLREDETKLILEDITKSISELNILKDELDDAVSKEAIKEVGGGLSTSWINIGPRTKLYAAMLVNAKQQDTIARTANIEFRLDIMMENMSYMGIDTKGMEVLVNEFSRMVSISQDFSKQTTLLLDTAKEESNNKELIASAKRSIDESSLALDEAYSYLKDIFKLARQHDLTFDSNNEELIEILVEATQ